jgi:hypothetical protein
MVKAMVKAIVKVIVKDIVKDIVKVGAQALVIVFGLALAQVLSTHPARKPRPTRVRKKNRIVQIHS